MSRYGPTPPESVEMLVEAGLLTERQAQAYVYRDVDPTPRKAVAEMLEISPNVLDKHLSAARQKVESAKATTEALQEIRFPDLPSECSDCEAALVGPWSENDDGEPVCLECAGIEESDLE